MSGRIILSGRKLHNRYFYYDDKEVPEKAVAMTEEDLKKETFAYAFFQPPYCFMITKSNFEKGNFFLDFCRLLFTDISQIEVYKWSTDSSNYFDEGKDWWGSFFWTVYNPCRDWYIGIIASETD